MDLLSLHTLQMLVKSTKPSGCIIYTSSVKFLVGKCNTPNFWVGFSCKLLAFWKGNCLILSFALLKSLFAKVCVSSQAWFLALKFSSCVWLKHKLRFKWSCLSSPLLVLKFSSLTLTYLPSNLHLAMIPTGTILSKTLFTPWDKHFINSSKLWAYWDFSPIYFTSKQILSFIVDLDDLQRNHLFHLPIWLQTNSPR